MADALGPASVAADHLGRGRERSGTARGSRGQGAALRRLVLQPVRRQHDRHLNGRVNSMHESYSALGGGGALLHHDARRGLAGRRRLRPLRSARRRHPHRVHRRPHGRPHPRAARQDDRAHGDHPHARSRCSSRRPSCSSSPALASSLPVGRSQLLASGPHGLTEMMYAYTSAANNNGSAFAGLTADQPYLNLTLALCMALGRFVPDRPRARPRRLACRADAGAPVTAGTHADPHPAVRRPARRRCAHRRRADLLPGPRPRADRGGPVMSRPGRAGWSPLPAGRAQARPPARLPQPRSSSSCGSARCSPPCSRSWTRRCSPSRVTVWLWATVLFANLAEAVAEGRGKAQAATLRAARTETTARRCRGATVPRSRCAGADLRDRRPRRRRGRPGHPGRRRRRRGHGHGRRVGDHRRVRSGHPRVRRRPVRRHRRHDRAVRPDRRCGSRRRPGETFIDRMIALVEGAARQKTPNEIALTILLTTLTIIFLLAVMAIQPMAVYSGAGPAGRRARRAARLPHPDDDRRAALGHRHRRHGPPRAAQRARHVRPRRRGRRRRLDPAARQDRHHHLGNRRAAELRPRRRRRSGSELLGRPTSSSLADETPEGRSIVELAAADRRRRDQRPALRADARPARRSCAFTAHTRMSGIDLSRRTVRAQGGGSDAVAAGSAARRAGRRRASGTAPRSSTASRAQAAPRSSSRAARTGEAARACSASSTSRTSSSPA